MTPSEVHLWEADFVRLFLSHVSSYKTVATKLRTELLKFQISAFVAHKDIEPSKEWQNEIEAALKTADGLVALMTPDFHKSKWTDQEIGIAIGQNKLIIPILLGNPLYGFISRYQALSGKNRSVKWLANQILKALLTARTTRRKMARLLVVKFAKSESFFEARDNLNLIEKIQYWDYELLDQVKKAVKQNDQISPAFRVEQNTLALIREIQGELRRSKSKNINRMA